MIKNSKFYIKDIKSVVIIGWCPNIDELIKINKSFKLKSIVITSPNQKKLFDKNLKVNIFKDIENNNFIKFIKNNCNIKNTLFLSISSMFVFKKKSINFFEDNLVNFFPSRLPYDTGRGGFSWHIMREDRIYNQLFHIIDEGMNTGPIIDSEKSLFPKNCKIPLDFEDYKWSAMNNFYKNFIRKITNNKNLNIKVQNKNLGRFNPSLNTMLNGYIDWNLNSYDLYNFINAFDEPHQGASTFINRAKIGRLFLKSVHLHGGDTSNHPYMTGVVSRHDKKWITVSTTGKHMLLIEKILNEKNKNIIDEIKEGDRLFTPYSFIESSKIDSTTYKP